MCNSLALKIFGFLELKVHICTSGEQWFMATLIIWLNLLNKSRYSIPPSTLIHQHLSFHINCILKKEIDLLNKSKNSIPWCPAEETHVSHSSCWWNNSLTPSLAFSYAESAAFDCLGDAAAERGAASSCPAAPSTWWFVQLKLCVCCLNWH